MRLLALCWTGFVLVFFTFSTTQEYYSMPCYPALALLLGCAMAAGGNWVKWGTRVLALVAACAALAVFTLWFLVRNTPAPGDIASALSHNPGVYTLSLGHMEDLTIESFAYLRAPLLVAGVAFTIGLLGLMLWRERKAFLAAAAMMVLFFHAARMALVTFDPYLSSRPLAEALLRSPAGTLVIDHHYYTFSSVFFYTGRNAWLLNGRFNNLVYGSYAPGAPDVFLTDEQWKRMWLGSGADLHCGGLGTDAAVHWIGGRGGVACGAAERGEGAIGEWECERECTTGLPACRVLFAAIVPWIGTARRNIRATAPNKKRPVRVSPRLPLPFD
jgi:hypothetical protein